MAEAERRRRLVLKAMTEEGYLTAAEQKALLARPLDPEDPSVAPADRFVKPPPKVSTLGEAVKGEEWGSRYFAEEVRQWLVEEFGPGPVLGGGLKVYTTLDLGMQKAAYEAVTTTLDRDGDPSAAIVALDDQGQVKAMMGGTDFDNDKFNLATDGAGRQPGSTFKTFALAEAVREGYSMQSVLSSPSSATFDDPRCTNGGEDWKVRGGPGGSSSLVSATKGSINTVFAELMVRLGPDKVKEMALDMGVASLAASDPVCALVLGSGDATVIDMAAGYSTLANRGVAKSPIMVTRVEAADGKVYDYTAEGREVLTTDQADRVTYALQQVIDGGTGEAADIGRPAAGKTGTTQSNADAWFVGYTPALTAAVWMGYPEGSIPMDDVHGIEVQGGTFPAEMWQKFMTAATANTEAADFVELDRDQLAVGETLDRRYGTSRLVVGGSAQNGVPSTTVPRSTVPQSTTPRSTAPRSTEPETETSESETSQTTVPSSTAPETTAATSTAPATTAAAATSATAVPEGGGASGASPDG
jgi:penicillin-binding protein 1A